MSSRHDDRSLNIIRDMRLVEKKLIEINIRLQIYTNIYNQCSNRLKALRRIHLNSMNLQNETSLYENPDYFRELDRMKAASRRIEELIKEKEKIKKILEDNMHRF